MFPTTSSPHSHVFVLRTADRHTLAAHRNSGKHRQEYPGTVPQSVAQYRVRVHSDTDSTVLPFQYIYLS